MSREVCGICWCPYDEDTGACACAPEPSAPPQRKPLTDEEIFKIENDIPDDVISDRAWTICFARAIERAHKIGGEG